MGRNLHRSLIFASEESARPISAYAFYGFTVMGGFKPFRAAFYVRYSPVPAVRSTTVIRPLRQWPIVLRRTALDPKPTFPISAAYGRKARESGPCVSAPGLRSVEG